MYKGRRFNFVIPAIRNKKNNANRARVYEYTRVHESIYLPNAQLST